MQKPLCAPEAMSVEQQDAISRYIGWTAPYEASLHMTSLGWFAILSDLIPGYMRQTMHRHIRMIYRHPTQADACIATMQGLPPEGARNG